MRIVAFFSADSSLSLPTIARSGQTFGGVGARAEGMGGAFVAVADDASAVYWNPAGIATGATFDLQVSGRADPCTGAGRQTAGLPSLSAPSLPVLGLSFYRTHTVPASPDRQNGGSGEVQIRTSHDHERRRDSRANRCIWACYRNNSSAWSGVDSSASDARTTVGFRCRGDGVGLGSVRLGRGGEEPPGTRVREGRRAGVRWSGRCASAPRWCPGRLPSGVHGPFSLAFDADLTRTPGASGRRRDGGSRRGVLAGAGSVRGSCRRALEHAGATRAGRFPAG